MNDNQSLIDKHRPKSLDEIEGHGSKIKKLKKATKKNKPVLLHGPAGTGKTSAAEALANDNDWNVVEINASSARTKDDIVSLANQIRTKAMGGKTLFILDEVDSMDGRSLKPLLKVLDDAPNPIVATANEEWKVPGGIKSRCKSLKFTLKKNTKKNVIQRVAEAEGIDISNRQIGQLATREGLRDALNDLQQFADSNADTDWDERETEDSPFAVTERVLRGKDYIGGNGMTPPDTVAFLDENVPGEFAGVEALRAFQALAAADRWNELVNRTQDYSWWKYSGRISEEVANLRTTEPYDGWMNINYPNARRQSSPYPSQASSQVALYDELKETDKPGYKAAFNYREFSHEVLPLLQEMDDEEKYQFILSESLSEEATAALDVTKTQYESWLVEEGEGGERDDAIEDVVEDSDEGRSVFDI